MEQKLAVSGTDVHGVSFIPFFPFPFVQFLRAHKPWFVSVATNFVQVPMFHTFYLLRIVGN